MDPLESSRGDTRWLALSFRSVGECYSNTYFATGRVFVSDISPAEEGGNKLKAALTSDIVQLTLIHPEKTLVLGVDSTKPGISFHFDSILLSCFKV